MWRTNSFNEWNTGPEFLFHFDSTIPGCQIKSEPDGTSREKNFARAWGSTRPGGEGWEMKEPGNKVEFADAPGNEVAAMIQLSPKPPDAQSLRFDRGGQMKLANGVSDSTLELSSSEQ